jgi:2-keto-4-pentenoate hydratase/2-oxohepta-3-ene-1,7-dioic acid hydratase in catechol pathway
LVFGKETFLARIRWNGDAVPARSIDGKTWTIGDAGIERSVDAIDFCCPVTPSKIIGVGRNFPDQDDRSPAACADFPEVFLMPPSALLDPEADVMLPPFFGSVLAEGEIAVVIGKKAKGLSTNDVAEHVLGYTLSNDLSGRDSNLDPVPSLLKKGCDGFLPVGPWIRTDLDPVTLKIETFVNGVRVQAGAGKDMRFSVADVVSFVSLAITLEPGDLISLGAPSPKPRLLPGDTVEVRVDGLGCLRNRIRLGRLTATRISA